LALLDNSTSPLVVIFYSIDKTVLRKCWNFSFDKLQLVSVVLGQRRFAWNPAWNFKLRERINPVVIHGVVPLSHSQGRKLI